MTSPFFGIPFHLHVKQPPSIEQIKSVQRLCHHVVIMIRVRVSTKQKGSIYRHIVKDEDLD